MGGGVPLRPLPPPKKKQLVVTHFACEYKVALRGCGCLENPGRVAS